MIIIDKGLDDKYFKDIQNLIKDFDSYQYCGKEFDIIVKELDGNIKDIKLLHDDDIYNKLDIYLINHDTYAINYDFKNYPLFSCYCEKITIYDSDTVIGINDDIIINLNEINLKSFDLVE